MRTAARRLARRALRPGVCAPCEHAPSLPPRCTEAAPAARAAGGGCRFGASRHGWRGFSAGPSPPPPNGPETPPDSGNSESEPEEVDLQSKYGSFSELYWSLQERKARLFLFVYRKWFEPAFDEAAFIDGATDAYFFVNELWPSGEVDKMLEFMTPPVAEAFAEMVAAYKADNMALSFNTTAFYRARITDFSLLSRGEMRSRGQGKRAWPTPRAAVATAASGEPSDTAEDGGGSGYVIPGVGALYLSFSVRYDVVDSVELRRGGPNGSLASKIKDSRGHVWTFARPMPRKIPFDGADTPWKLMNVE